MGISVSLQQQAPAAIKSGRGLFLFQSFSMR